MKLNKSKMLFSSAFTLIELLVVIAIIAILASIALPVFSSVQERGKQTKDMSNGKQIALALKQFALDNNGEFPNKDYDSGGGDYSTATPLTAADNSNQAFRWLLPTYLTSEDIFVVPGSKWSPGADNRLDVAYGTQTDTLNAGENGYAYVCALNDTSNPQYPLLADGFAVGNIPNWVTDKTIKGGVWGARRACIIFVDGSGRVMTVDDTTNYTVNRPGRGYSLFDLAQSAAPEDWLSATNFVLNPDNDGNP
jgi:prepilin-type N-terminal cleavage/methylation domain-containing protein